MNELLETLYNSGLSSEKRLSPLFTTVLKKKQESFDTAKPVYLELNYLLEHLDPSRTNTIIAVGLLRCTSQMKHILPHWFECRDRVATYLDGQNLDTKHILRGLYAA
jgi:hypothetical protein